MILESVRRAVNVYNDISAIFYSLAKEDTGLKVYDEEAGMVVLRSANPNKYDGWLFNLQVSWACARLSTCDGGEAMDVSLRQFEEVDCVTKAFLFFLLHTAIKADYSITDILGRMIMIENLGGVKEISSLQEEIAIQKLCIPSEIYDEEVLLEFTKGLVTRRYFTPASTPA